MKYALTLATAAALALSTAASAQSIDAKIEPGTVRGSEAEGVIAWKGIPFAAPPIGDNRWRAPQPAAKWSGVREAKEYGHDCMQKPFGGDAAPLGTEPSEDCLVLNVWRPAGAAKKLPVMVWIYGGGFVNGGSSPDVYNGKQFAKHGIVFVSFNYRLGRFGWFAHPALTAAHEGLVGNYAYMDQLAALKWIKTNIAAFGGDANNVTVFGESAGGSSTLDLLTMPAARGLFNRVAVMSGGGRGGVAPARRLSEDRPGVPSAETIGVNFATKAGVDSKAPDALAKLRALSSEQVLMGLGMMSMFQPDAGPPTYVGGPIQEDVLVNGNPKQMFEAGKQAPVPVMIGSTSADIGFSVAKTMDEVFAPFGDKAAAARAAYDPANSGDVRGIGTDVSRDHIMAEPARYAAGMITKAGQPAYLYRFGYVAEAMRAEWKTGAPHATDIPWVFDTVEAKYGAKLTPKDRAAAKAANAYFAAFAKTGNPNVAGLPAWKAYTRANSFVMDFTPDGPVGGADPLKARLDLVEQTAPR